ncbi:amphi-Trp domain-containing protein [Natrinema marinum]|uniref:amphi-Trp domain-containing protein n=1 Tax=Natrinema marinum TaxID=2961598 RepID=UPI0020C8BFE7|nr:amphi-Trp domain-containing protein [Natrinema marinum]
MSDSPDDADRTEASSDEEFDLERAYDRTELAAVFREFADAFDDGRSIRLDGDQRTVRVAVPRGVIAEFEVERDAGAEPAVGELAIELEWDDPDGSSVQFADRDADDARDAARGVRSAATAADAASAVLSPEDAAGGGREEEPAADTDGDGGDPAVTADPAEAEATDGERSDDGGRRSRFEVYEDRAGEWRWRLVHWNGNIVGDSGEGYASRSNAERAARSVMRSAATAIVERRRER